MKGVSQKGHLMAESADTAWLHAQEKASMDPGSARTEVDGDGARAALGSFPELFLGFSVLSQNSCSAASGFLFPPLLPSDWWVASIEPHARSAQP